MKTEKVINQLKDLIIDRRSHINDDDDIEWNEIWLRDIEALDQAIEILKSHIPILPAIDSIDGDYICSKCGNYLSSELKFSFPFCCRCGQALTLETLRNDQGVNNEF